MWFWRLVKGTKLSSFICDDDTIEDIISGIRYMAYDDRVILRTPEERAAVKLGSVETFWNANGYETVDTCDGKNMGRLLVAYNQIMTGIRYGSEPDAFVGAERYGDGRRATPGEIYGACCCYDYQVSEAESYEKSGIKQFIRMLEKCAAMAAFKRLEMPVPYGHGGHDMTERYKA